MRYGGMSWEQLRGDEPLTAADEQLLIVALRWHMDREVTPLE